MKFSELVDEVTAKTSGTKGDPLSREEVEAIVQETVDVLEARNLLQEGAFTE